MTVWYPCTNSSLQISIFQIRQIFNISYFPQFNLSFAKNSLFPKTPKNHPKIYTKLPNSGQCNKHRDLASLETWPRYWQKGRVKRRENSLHVYPRLKLMISVKISLKLHNHGLSLKARVIWKNLHYKGYLWKFSQNFCKRLIKVSAVWNNFQITKVMSIPKWLSIHRIILLLLRSTKWRTHSNLVVNCDVVSWGSCAHSESWSTFFS